MSRRRDVHVTRRSPATPPRKSPAVPQTPATRAPGVVACFAALLVFATMPAPASASPLLELIGGNFGDGGFNARGTGASAASAYFNPALLPQAEQGLELGWLVLNDAISIDLDGRSSDMDVGVGNLNVLREQYPVPTLWLEEGCAAGDGFGVESDSRSVAAPAAPVAVQPAELSASTAERQRQQRVAELVERLEPKLSRSSRGLSWSQDAQGRAHVHLEGRFQHAVITRRAPDGRFVTECVHNPQAAAAALEARQEPAR